MKSWRVLMSIDVYSKRIAEKRSIEGI